MKWPGGEANGMLSHTNGHVSSPQIIRQQIPDPNRPQLARSQDDAMVGYVFQRPQSDPDFPIPPPFSKQHQRWALGDESIIDSHEKWKYPVTKLTHPMHNVVPYEMHPIAIKPGTEHLVFLNNHMTAQQMAAAASLHQQPRNGQGSFYMPPLLRETQCLHCAEAYDTCLLCKQTEFPVGGQ